MSDFKIIGNMANVQYDYVPESGVTKTSSTLSDVASLTVYEPHLYTKKDSPAKTVAPGGIVQFSLISVNDGSINLDSIQFKDIFDANMSYIPNSAQAYVNGVSTIYSLTTDPDWIATVVGPFSPNDEVVMNVAAMAATTIDFNSNPTVTNQFAGGYVYTNPADGVSVTVAPGTPTGEGIVVLDLEYASLSMSKAVESVVNDVPSGISITSAISGATIAYVISITNLGNVTAVNVHGSDLLPDELRVITPAGVNLPINSYTINQNYFEFYGLSISAASVTNNTIIGGTMIINITGIVNTPY